MNLNQLKSEQLEAYLAALTPKAAEFLIREVERDRLKGGNAFPHELVLGKAREIIRKAEVSCARLSSAQRMFCKPFEGLLVDRTTELKSPGRITRSASQAVWKWLLTDIASDALPQLSVQLTEAALLEDAPKIQSLSGRLYKLCHERLDAALGSLEPDTKAYGRIAAHLGGEQILQDALEICHCLKRGAELLAHLDRAPMTVSDLSDEDVELYAQWYAEFESKCPGEAYFLLLSLMSRCPRAQDILNVVIQVVGSNDAEVIRRHSTGAAVEAMLHDIEVSAQRAREDIVACKGLTFIRAHLAQFHAHASALCDALELDLKGAWGHRLVAVRSELSATIGERIAAAPRLIKAALIRKSGRRELQSTALTAPDPQKIEDAEFAVNLLIELRAFLGQLTLNAVYSRVKSEVEQFLEVIAERLLRDINDGPDDARTFALEGYLSAGRLMQTVFGKEAAELYLRRGRAASQHAAMTA